MEKKIKPGIFGKHYLKLYLKAVGHGFKEKNNNLLSLTKYAKQHIEHMPFLDESFVNECDLGNICDHYDEKMVMQEELLHSYKNYDCNMKWVSKNKEYA